MIDEHDVRRMLHRRADALPVTPLDTPTAVGRARRRLLVNGVVTTALAVAIAVAAVAGVHAIRKAPIPADRPKLPPAPAAPGTLAYTLDGDIYVADPDGSNAVKIADGRSDVDCNGSGAGVRYWVESDDMWSPDGRYLAYRYWGCSSSRERGPKGVVISDAKGNVFAKFPTGLGWQIRWSPNSKRVAVWDDFGKTVGVYGTDGVRQAHLTVPGGGGGGDTDPYWMPDGTGVVVGDLELPLDGGAPRPAPPSFYASLDDSRVHSPDGSRVAYVDHRTLTLARSGGSRLREVSGNWAGAPSWSPTGDRIAITTRSRVSGAFPPFEVRVIDVATGSMTLVTEGERGSELEVVGFTPQGDRILFVRSEGTGSWSLWSIRVDGSDARLILDGDSDNFYRVPWSPGTGTG